MMYLLKKYFIITVAVYLLTQIIPSFVIAGGWRELLRASLVLAIFIIIARPIVNLVMLPLNLLTLNLSSWLANIAIIYLWTILVSDIKITAWHFAGGSFGPVILSEFNFATWQVIVLSAIFLITAIQILNWLLK